MLKDTLQEMKAASAGQTPPEIMETMLNSRKTLSNSDILSRVIKVGDKMPDLFLINGIPVADFATELVKTLEIAAIRGQGVARIAFFRLEIGVKARQIGLCVHR